MSHKINTKNKNTMIWRRIFIIILSFFTILLIVNIVRLTDKFLITAQKKQIAREKYSMISSQEIDLQAKVSELNTDEGIEKSIRDRFPVVKEGEQVILIIDNDDIDKNNENKDKPSFRQFLKSLFSKKE